MQHIYEIVSVIFLRNVYTMNTVDLTFFAPQLLTESADTKYNRFSISDRLNTNFLEEVTDVKRSRVY